MLSICHICVEEITNTNNNCDVYRNISKIEFLFLFKMGMGDNDDAYICEKIYFRKREIELIVNEEL